MELNQIVVLKKVVSVIILFCVLLMGCRSSNDLEWTEEEYYRWADVSPGFFGKTGFKPLSSARTGIDFANNLSEEEIASNRHYLNGSGVAAGDINGNGLTDLYLASLSGSNRLYKNLGGMEFEDITEKAGVSHEGYYSTGAVFADVNGNGHLDLLVSAMHGENVLYINDGSGKFQLKEESGLETAKGSTTLALADITGNGYLDLYVTNYKEISVKDIYTSSELSWENILNEPVRLPTDTYTLAPPFDKHYQIQMHNGELIGIPEVGETDNLYLNKGGFFEKVTDTRSVFLDENEEPFGLQPDWGLTAKFQDLNGNGLQDLYVCNDFHTPDRIWINQGNGTFRAIAWEAIRNLTFSCMGVDFSDVNRNGSTDIYTTGMLSPYHNRRLTQAGLQHPVPVEPGDIKSRPVYDRNSLFLKREDHTYVEISRFSDTEATGWSWATGFMDVNLNGYEDILVSTGYLYDVLDIDSQITTMHSGQNIYDHFTEFTRRTPPLYLQNRILKNNGDLTFSDVSSNWGFTEQDVSHGMAFADLNNNGTLDVILNRMNREAAIYQNTTRSPRIAVRLRGEAPNTRAIGARVELYGGPVKQFKEISAGGEYASGSDTQLMFAAGDNNSEHQLKIFWPDGRKSIIDNVVTNRIYEIDQTGAEWYPDEVTESKIEKATLFEDISARINHRHYEEPFDDFEYQPLLPEKLSQPGPGVAWIDFNQNGRDDLFITTGRGGTLSLYENTDNGYFRRAILDSLNRHVIGDQTSIIGWHEGDTTRIVVGISNYETGRVTVPSAYFYSINSREEVRQDSIPGVLSTTGPIAAADVNGNGLLDLFIGGRNIPGQYPRDADSRLFLNMNGSFIPDDKNSDLFSGLGLVTGAVFSDINQNGHQDLLISTEWGTLKLFENHNGIFKETTQETGLNRFAGKWNGITTGDFTNNGYPDIVATNIGLNSYYQLRNNQPFRIYFDDWSMDGRVEMIEAYANENGDYVPVKRLYQYQRGNLRLNHMSSHQEFANATLNEILGEDYATTPYKEINTLEHMLFLNRGGEFEARPLPRDTQFTRAFHAGVADVDNDGNEDLFLSQNFFALPNDVSRQDGGRGILLKGDGAGNFAPVPGSESGIRVYGEQRGAAFGDLNRDGKVDLVVTQNGAETRLYLNRTEREGYRIRLAGPTGNREGVGSRIRLVYGNGSKGPAREVRKGSGYASGSSSVQVMGAAETDARKIEVRWFDGTVANIPVEPGRMEYVIRYRTEINE